MSLEKIERNELIATLYDQGKTNREIWSGLQEAGHLDLSSVASVKMQVSKLRKAGKLSKERPGGMGKPIRKQQVAKVITPQVKKLRTRQVDKSVKLQGKGSGKYKPVTFRISEETEWQLKTLAVARREQVSELVREIFNDYLSRSQEVEK